MANIKGFDAHDNIGLNPTDRGSDAAAGAARRIGGFYSQVAGATEQLGAEKNQMWKTLGQDANSSIAAAGDVVLKDMDHRDISAGTPAAAKILDGLDQKWNEIAKNADPNDRSIRQKFLQEQVQPALDQFKEGFSTENSQAFADQQSNHILNHFVTKTAADQATLAGIAVKVNYQKTANSLASTVASDPSSLDTALSMVDHSVGAMVDSSPTLDATTAASVKAEAATDAKKAIVHSAAIGLIEKNPNVDLAAFQKKYGEYIGGAEMLQLQKAAQTQAKVNANADRQAVIQQRQLADQNVHAAATRTITDNVQVDPQTNQTMIKPQFFKDTLDIARKNPDAPNAAETVRTMLNWGEAQQNKEAKPVDDPVVKSDLMTRMFSPDNPTTTLDLMKARAEGKISDPTFQAYHGLVTELEQSPIKGPVWDDTIAAVKGNLILNSEGVPGKDIVGEGNYAKWAQTFIPQYLSMKRAGTLPANALDVKDPTSMISQTMAPFHRDIAQRANDYTNMLLGLDKPGGTATPRNDTMPAIPPPAQRLPGSVYETPKGKMKWTGTGWVQP